MIAPVRAQDTGEELVARAMAGMLRSNVAHRQMFMIVVAAGLIRDALECVVLDQSGWLWVCREEYDFEALREPLARGRVKVVPYLMPVCGPCPLSRRRPCAIDAASLMPEGELAERVDLMARARAILQQHERRRA